MKILNTLFDRVYVLWLPRYVKRRQRLEEQLRGVEVEWVEAYEHRDYSLDELRKRVTALAGPQCQPLNQNIPQKNLAIWLGQYEVRNRILERKERSLVLEDDAWFLPDAARRLEHYFEELRGDPINNTWKLLYLFRENPASPLDWSYRVPEGPPEEGFIPGRIPKFPHFPGQTLPGQPDCGRELIVRKDGSVLDHVYRASREKISTAAYAISHEAVAEMRKERVIWTNDWWVARLTEPDHPLHKDCYCVTPYVVLPRYVKGEL